MDQTQQLMRRIESQPVQDQAFAILELAVRMGADMRVIRGTPRESEIAVRLYYGTCESGCVFPQTARASAERFVRFVNDQLPEALRAEIAG